MKNCYALDFEFNPLPDNFQFPISMAPDPNAALTTYMYGIDALTIECKNWISASGLTFNGALLFEQQAHYTNRRIHIDGAGPAARTFAVNWNYSDDKFVIEWFKAHTAGTIYTNTFPRTIKFREDEVELIESSNITGPVLINPTIPHSVINFQDHRRYFLSLTFNEKFSWPDTIKYFSKWIKE